MAKPYTNFTTLGLGLGILLSSCGGTPEAETNKDDNAVIQDDAGQGTQVLAIGGRSFGIPSPVQTAYAIRKAGLAYQKDLTTPLDKGDAVTGKSDQAILLGMYGADLAYVTVHRDGQRSLATMQAIEKLASKLELSNAFDRAMVDRFKANLGSEDSLLRFSGVAFRAADQYLKNNDRDDVSALVLAGGWVGSMHLTLSDPATATNQELLDRIGEQKSTLNGLVQLLGAAELDDRSTTIHKAMKELKTEFDAVTITYTYEKPVTDNAARTTYINSTSTVTISEDKLSAIKAKVDSIRNLILA